MGVYIAREVFTNGCGCIKLWMYIAGRSLLTVVDVYSRRSLLTVVDVYSREVFTNGCGCI